MSAVPVKPKRVPKKHEMFDQPPSGEMMGTQQKKSRDKEELKKQKKRKLQKQKLRRLEMWKQSQ